MSFILFFVLSLSVHAFESDKIYEGKTLEEVSLSSIFKKINPGTVVFLGELHTVKAHHDKQVQFLETLAQEKPDVGVSVGMEFFEYPDQGVINLYTDHLIGKEELLPQINWGGEPFEFYEAQVLFPKNHGGMTWALNLPRSITRKVSQSGLEILTQDERAMLPPQFELGNELYLERFKEIMGNHVPPQKIANYFISQSLWDDTMAWRICEFLQKNPNQVLNVIVGDFHVAYGGGLPDRVHHRCGAPTVIISQLNFYGLNSDQIMDEMIPRDRHGVRADFIWISQEEWGSRIP